MTQTYGFYVHQGSDSLLPIVKINCQEGRIWRIDRVQAAQGWESIEVDITATCRFIPDFTSLELGAIRFGDPGVDFQMQPFDAWVAAGRPRKTPEGYRFGFRVPILLSKECHRATGDVRHLAHTSAGVMEAISLQFAEYQRRVDVNGALLLPILALTKFEKRQRGQFKNFEPVFTAAQWVARPEIFDETLAAPVPEDDYPEPNAASEDDLPF